MALTRTRLILLLFLCGVMVCLAGCGAPEHIVTATCVAPGGQLSMSIVLLDVEGGAIGHYNGRHDELGTILRLVENAENAEHDRWDAVRTLDSLHERVSLERHWLRSVHRLPLELDVDGEVMAEPLHGRVEAVVLGGSTMVLLGAEKKAIADVLQAINRDPEALRVLRQAGPQERFVVVSSVVTGQSASLTYFPGWRRLPDAPFVAINTFRVDDAYFHPVYSCEPLKKVAARAQAEKTAVPAVYFYTAVRYDEATKRARLDPRPFVLDGLGSPS